MENKDLTRFKHMLESAQAILSFARGRKRIDLDKDRQFLSAEMQVIFDNWYQKMTLGFVHF